MVKLTYLSLKPFSNHLPPHLIIHSRKQVGNFPRQVLRFGNPFPLKFCYPVYISVSLCRGVLVLKLSVFSWRLGGSIAFVFALSAPLSRATAATSP